jgi:hypothetical protein
MNEQEKARVYGELLNEHTRLHNKINEIVGQNIELSKEQKDNVTKLKNRQVDILRKINQLLSR